jgi:D-serine deaminase-like pyridoxal phosphate-dependent protein
MNPGAPLAPGPSRAREAALRRYETAIGAVLDAVTTPALLVDLEALESNIDRMARSFAEMPSELRPHIKVHKCPEIARRQVEAGAIGVATATVREAVAMAEAGIRDVLVANQVVGAEKIAALLELDEGVRVTVAVDSPANIADLSAMASARGRQLEILVELDIGQYRCGARDAATALHLGEQVAASPGLRVRGMQGYEGHCMLEPDQDTRREMATEAIAKLLDAVDVLEAAGIPCETVSGGGTGTWFITGANPRVDEVQAGSYALMDAFHGDLVPGGFEVAMTVLATAISRHDRTVVLDAGRKAIGVDHAAPRVVGEDGASVRFVAEEHTLLDFPGPPPFDVGDRVRLVAGYGPTTANLHDAFLVVRDDTVIDAWPITARGFVP